MVGDSADSASDFRDGGGPGAEKVHLMRRPKQKKQTAPNIIEIPIHCNTLHLHYTWHSTTQHSQAQHSTAHHCTTLHTAISYNTTEPTIVMHYTAPPTAPHCLVSVKSQIPDWRGLVLKQSRVHGSLGRSRKNHTAVAVSFQAGNITLHLCTDTCRTKTCLNFEYLWSWVRDLDTPPLWAWFV
jgi:hypothetical protein